MIDKIEDSLAVALPPWEASSCGVVSLYDLMKKFNLVEFSLLISRIGQAAVDCRDRKDEGETKIPDLTKFIKIAEDANKICGEAGFDRSEYKGGSLFPWLRELPQVANYPGMHIEMLHLHQDVMLDVQSKKFLQIENSEFFENKDLLGAEVWVAFPKAHEDILDAGNCLSVDLNTAAVFHLMHVVEWGLRALCVDLNLPEIVDDRKANRTIPIEYAVWEKILQQLPGAVDKRVSSISDKGKKQDAQTFYYPALKEIGGFKEAWRNHVMHTRSSYNSEDAIAVKSHVERFMKSLAKYGIGEVSE